MFAKYVSCLMVWEPGLFIIPFNQYGFQYFSIYIVMICFNELRPKHNNIFKYLLFELGWFMVVGHIKIKQKYCCRDQIPDNVLT